MYKLYLYIFVVFKKRKMEDFKFHKQDYITDEGEIYLEQQYQAKTEERNSALLIFLSFGIPALFAMLLFHIFQTLLF